MMQERALTSFALYRVAQKSKPLPDYQKIVTSYYSLPKEIRFLRQIKEMIKHYNIIRKC